MARMVPEVPQEHRQLHPPRHPTPAEIAENDFARNIPRYVDTFEEEEEIDLKAVRAEREKLKAELAR